MFIVIEGVEGAGKTSLVEKISKYLNEKELSNICTREPGATTFGKQVRALILDSKEEIGSLSELFLFAADRANHISEVIKPALDKGSWVICDRYTDSTLAYQGYGRGISIPLVENINNIATSGLKPDLTFLLDLDVEVGLKRVAKRGVELDRIEQSSLTFHKNVRDGFKSLVTTKHVVINADQPREEVFLAALPALNKLLQINN